MQIEDSAVWELKNMRFDHLKKYVSQMLIVE